MRGKIRIYIAIDDSKAIYIAQKIKTYLIHIHEISLGYIFKDLPTYLHLYKSRYNGTIYAS